jgi:predicted regulator of Ras-like GTPase activity (Roadblock/LC7/MglB family)
MMEEILKDIQKLVPKVLGVIVASDEGLPMGYSISRSLSIQDPIIIAGLVSAASLSRVRNTQYWLVRLRGFMWLS